ncbi:MAG TPA: aromatic ring-hydroxylating dioxygenase subunit alpha [Beijerinckiaceae bacterium]
MTFLWNAWYVAGWPREFGDALVAKTLLGRPLVFYRAADGDVVALEDRCPHRHVPLSQGVRAGDEIECAYHGLAIDRTGRCVRVPAQESIPTRARIASYPTTELHGWTWIWMGDPARADVALIPDFHWLGDPAYAATGDTKHVEADYRLLNDNLLDLSHVGFVHATTIGNAEMGAKGEIRVERIPRGVRVTRWVLDCAPPPTYCKTGVFKPDDRIDRWQIIDYEAPSAIRIHVGGALAGTGAPQGRRVGGLGMWVLHAMTPETETTTHYHWAVGRDFHVDDPEVTKIVGREISTAFEQDREILKIQQASILRHGAPRSVDIAADAGGVQARRILAEAIRREQAEERQAEDA